MVNAVDLKKGDVFEFSHLYKDRQVGDCLGVVAEVIKDRVARVVFCGCREREAREELKENLSFKLVRFLSGNEQAKDEYVDVAAWRRVCGVLSVDLEGVTWLGKSKEKVVKALDKTKSLALPPVVRLPSEQFFPLAPCLREGAPLGHCGF